MRIGRLMAAIAAMWLAATAVAGQSAESAQPLPDFPIRPLSEARADKDEAGRLIAGSGHAALFENASDRRGPAIRHRASGMICRFEAGSDLNTLIVYEHKPGAEDVSCQTQVDGVSLTHYASQYTPTPTAESEVHAAIRAMRQRWPELRAYDGEVAVAAGESGGLPRMYVSRASVKLDDGDHLTKVMVAQVGVWTIKQRMTVRADRALAGDLWSETLMVRTLAEIVRGAAAETSGPGDGAL